MIIIRSEIETAIEYVHAKYAFSDWEQSIVYLIRLYLENIHFLARIWGLVLPSILKFDICVDKMETRIFEEFQHFTTLSDIDNLIRDYFLNT